MASATIGALRAVFGADTIAFEKGTGRVQKEINKTKREFAKFGKSISSLGKGLTVGVSGPLALIGATSLKSGAKSAEAMAQVEAGLKSMGGASGKTSEELKKTAQDLEGLSNFNADDILKTVTANMLTFGNISGESFDRAQQAALDLSERLDQDLKSSTIQIGKALNDPIKGITALSRVGIQFTDDQKAMIEGMVEAGDVAGAQAMILAELERQYAGSAKAAQDAVPGSDLQDAYARFSRVVGELALKVIPPLTAGLTRVLDGFNNLSPGMQKGIVIAGGFLAALGPVVTVIGTLVTAFSPLLAAVAVFTGASGVGGATVAVAALLGPLGLLVAALVGAAGLYVAYKRSTEAAREAKVATEELSDVVEKGKASRAEHISDVEELAQAQLKLALNTREAIAAELEQSKAAEMALRKSLSKKLVSAGTSTNPLIRGVNKVMADKDLKAGLALEKTIADAEKELAAQDARIDKLREKLGILPDVITDTPEVVAAVVDTKVENVASQIASLKEQMEKMKGCCDEGSDSKAQGFSSAPEIVEETDAYKELAEALRLATEEYCALLEKVKKVKSAMGGASASAGDLKDSVQDLGGSISSTVPAANKSFSTMQSQLVAVGDTGVDAFDRTLSSFNGLLKGIQSGDLGGILGGISGVFDSIFGGSSGGTVGKIGSILKVGTQIFSAFSGGGASFASAAGSNASIGATAPTMSAPVVKLEVSAAEGKLFRPLVTQISAETSTPIAQEAAFGAVGKAQKSASQSQDRSL